jgi:hypothetical protein
MTLPFARQMSGRATRLTLDWAPVSLKSWSWNWLGRLAPAARSPTWCPSYPQESRKYHCRRMGDYAATREAARAALAKSWRRGGRSTAIMCLGQGTVCESPWRLRTENSSRGPRLPQRISPPIPAGTARKYSKRSPLTVLFQSQVQNYSLHLPGCLNSTESTTWLICGDKP